MPSDLLLDSLTHGAPHWPGVDIESYSLEIDDHGGQLGDRASQTAFRALLAEWSERVGKAGDDPFGGTPVEQMSKRELDRIAASGSSEAARAIATAVDAFAERLAEVTRRFLEQPEWQGVERVVIGGGFKESDIGRLVVRLAGQRLADAGHPVDMRVLHHAADDAGLMGWAQLATTHPQRGMATMAVDIGGTNVRSGIVALDHDDPADLARLRVLKREKWRHADDDPEQDDLVEGIVRMLRRLIAHAEQHDIALAPFVGVACPGIIGRDGSILRGADNLPGDWHAGSFHLPRRLSENLGRLGGEPVRVLMHNDAVVQGLSEVPFLQDVEKWAVLTIGTGLGNASYRHVRESAGQDQ